MIERKRGSVYRGWLPEDPGRACVIVSRDERNASWNSVLVAVITENQGPAVEAVFERLPTAVRLDDAEPAEGLVLLDFIHLVRIDELGTYLGRVSGAALHQIDKALLSVFGLNEAV